MVIFWLVYPAVAALVSLVLGMIFINFSGVFFQSKVRQYTPEGHQKKNNTPTMGGIFFLLAALITTATFAYFNDLRLWLAWLGCLGFAVIGFGDDWGKIRFHCGMSARTKFILQWLVAGVVMTCLVMTGLVSTDVHIPILNLNLPIGWLYLAWSSFVVVACANAVNLTDGLDGLAAGVSLPTLLLFAFIAFATGWQGGFIFALTLFGALFGFLWFNRFPARVFMGDVGALALGAALALLALITKQELLIPLAGGVFLLEELSVMLQVFSFKYRGKRIFKMAPIHHHFELSGVKETRITAIFSLISGLLCLAAFALYRLQG